MILDQNLSRQLLPEKRDSIFQVSETQTCHLYQDDSLHNAGRTLSLNLAAKIYRPLYKNYAKLQIIKSNTYFQLFCSKLLYFCS